MRLGYYWFALGWCLANATDCLLMGRPLGFLLCALCALVPLAHLKKSA